jgi:hypothetical protein
MRKSFSLKLMLSAALAGFWIATYAQTANVQVIHNCADPAADTVDVWVNGAKAIPGLAFRTATSFLSIPAGVVLNVGVAPNHSSAITDTIASFAVGPLATDSNYVVIASGVVGTGFAPNPNSISTAFTLNVIANAKTSAPAGNVNLAIFHGTTDAPAVDVKVTGGAALATDLEYGQYAGYLEVPATWYPISIYPAGSGTALVNYVADLSTLGGGAAVVLASGFLTPSSNDNGPAFAVIAALANGTVLTLPVQTFANVQVAHNCADPSAAAVDVYVDGAKAVDSFAFRTATPFIPLLAGVNHTVAIAPPNSTSVSQALATFDSIILTANENYVVVASGVVGSGFAANPSGISTAFTLDIIPNAETTATNPSNTDLAIFHGVTDAPAVSVVVQGGSSLVQGLQYGYYTSYVDVPAGSYVIDVDDSSESTVIAAYTAKLSALADSAGIVYASGFLSPSANNNGPAFGLYLSLPSGGPFIPLSLVSGIENTSADKVQMQLFPNPASTQFTAKFTLPNASPVSMDITDLSGQIVKQVINNTMLSGNQQIQINTADLSGGMYFLRINDGESLSVNKFLIVK